MITRLANPDDTAQVEEPDQYPTVLGPDQQQDSRVLDPDTGRGVEPDAPMNKGNNQSVSAMPVFQAHDDEDSKVDPGNVDFYGNGVNLVEAKTKGSNVKAMKVAEKSESYEQMHKCEIQKLCEKVAE